MFESWRTQKIFPMELLKKLENMLQNLLSAAVVIGALRVKLLFLTKWNFPISLILSIIYSGGGGGGGGGGHRLDFSNCMYIEFMSINNFVFVVANRIAIAHRIATIKGHNSVHI